MYQEINVRDIGIRPIANATVESWFPSGHGFAKIDDTFGGKVFIHFGRKQCLLQSEDGKITMEAYERASNVSVGQKIILKIGTALPNKPYPPAEWWFVANYATEKILDIANRQADEVERAKRAGRLEQQKKYRGLSQIMRDPKSRANRNFMAKLEEVRNGSAEQLRLHSATA